MSSVRVIYTVGHSTRPAEEFTTLLKAYGIGCVIDVRTVPQSQHNPQFGGDNLARILAQHGIRYAHVPEVGGLRQSKNNSVNAGWKNRSFRGYADHMASEEFRRGFLQAAELAAGEPAALMCAEAVPWRCHRFLLSDAFVEADWEVRHIMSLTKAESHVISPLLRVMDGKITYPASGAQTLGL